MAYRFGVDLGEEPAGGTLKEELPVSSREHVIRRLLRAAHDGETRVIRSEAEIDVVGHRLVHGGPYLTEPVTFTPEVHSAIESVSAFAPLHIQAELEGVRIIEQLLGDVPQVAVFDTGFHQQIPAEAARNMETTILITRTTKSVGSTGVSSRRIRTFFVSSKR